MLRMKGCCYFLRLTNSIMISEWTTRGEEAQKTLSLTAVIIHSFSVRYTKVFDLQILEWHIQSQWDIHCIELLYN